METPTTLIEFSNGAVADLTELKGEQSYRVELSVSDRFLMWEALRIMVATGEGITK